MRAMLFDAPGLSLRPAEVDEPEPGPGQLLIEVGACAVCRTDLHLVDGELSVGHRELGKAAVDVAAREARAVAQVLPAAAAELAVAAGPAQPRYAHAAVTAGDRADDLVAQDERRVAGAQLAVDEMEVGAADATGRYLDQQLPWLRFGLGHFGRPQRAPGRVEEHGPHHRGQPRRRLPSAPPGTC